MESIQIKAYAKINLGLDVLSRRPDGYHNVRMIMQTVRLFDSLNIRKKAAPGISIHNNLSYLPEGENNLIWRAANLFFRAIGATPSIHVDLKKRIPVAAGMAGGSSDAAATLAALNELYHANFNLAALQRLGVQIGADVPYCLLQGTALSEGIGEILTPLPPAPKAHCLIVKPHACVSTKSIYEHLDLKNAKHPDIDAMLSFLRKKNLSGLCASFGNILESVTIPRHPEIAFIKEKMLGLGALGSLMSGSGPTVFGLFDNKRKAEHAFYEFKIGEYGRQTYLVDFYQP